MTTIEPGRWVLVALAIVGLALAATAVSAHDTDATTAHPGDGTDHYHSGTEAHPYNGTVAEWTDWMERHTITHMGPGSVAWMERHTGLTVEQMAQYMADGNYTVHGAEFPAHEHNGGDGIHGGGYDDHTDDTHRSGYGMAGRGHGC